MRIRRKIALLIAQPEENYQRDFIKGFLGQAFADDLDVCVFSMYQKHQSTKVREQAESTIFTLLLQVDMFDAIVVHADSLQAPGLAGRIEEQLHACCDKPVLFVDGESKYFPYVMSDNYQPAKLLVSHLIEKHGYTDIAYLTGNEFHPHARQRLQAFLDCMKEHGLEVGENRIFYGDFWINSGVGAAERLLQNREHLPQAVACANDFMAMGLIDELERNGIRVPEDIAVCGVDARPEGQSFAVPLTTISMPLTAYGGYVFRCVKACCQGKALPEFSPAYNPIIGSSCGCGCGASADVLEAAAEEFETLRYFDFNESTLEDDMMEQTELAGVVNAIFSYIDSIRPFESFNLCLNTDWYDEAFLAGGHCSGYSENMLHVLYCGPKGRGSDRIVMEEEFDRKILLPELLERSRNPRAFYFTPLFYGEQCFGYAAIGFGESEKPYGPTYKRWLAMIMHGLESFRRFRILSKRCERLENDQIRDGLTGLYSYRGYLKTVQNFVRESQVGNLFLDILVVELCGINEIFMQLGSNSGNKVIVDFSQLLFVAAKQDLICNLGNGEFLVCLVETGVGAAQLETIEKNIEERLADYCSRNGFDGKLKLMFGTASGAVDGEEQLGNLVGEAMGKKNANKLQEQRRDDGALTEEELRRMEMVADILDRNRLIYHFQPIVETEAGEVYGYEALMRSDTEEPISPLEILKYAEILGRLDDVETATFSNVIAYVRQHADLFESKKIFINSIPGTEISEGLSASLQEQIKELDGKIVVELTEQTEVGDEALAQLKQKYESLGVDTAIDDYGTGYSNVYNLLRYMPKYVKIDRMLLANIQLSAQKQHFVKEIIEFSHNNRITVLAEGVETAEELKMVIALGVDMVQGYYAARPSQEVLQNLDYRIQTEIVQFAQYAVMKNSEKIYRAGQDGAISLVKIATGHYAKIRFSKDQVRHRDITISGFPGFLANVEIEIEDGYEGRIELKDVDLAVMNDLPAIRIGEGCDVTLVLNGDNVIERGGILVPESARLTVKGDGNLYIKQIAVNGYGIGNDNDKRHGDLIFDQDGTIDVRGNTMQGVGIGSGLGGRIHVLRGGYCVHLSGVDAVGMGSISGDTEITLERCALDFNISSSTNIGVGSLRGSAKLDFSYMRSKNFQSGNRCVGIGTLEEGSAVFFRLKQAFLEFSGRSNLMCAIGSVFGDVEIDATEYSFKITVAGNEAISVGNLKRTAKIATSHCNLVASVNNELDFDVGAGTLSVEDTYAEFTLNGEKTVWDRTERNGKG